MAKLITIIGEVSDIQPENGSDFTLRELYKHIGCHCVERLPLSNGCWMWLDEEGKINGNKFNAFASAFWALAKPIGYQDDYIYGNVLICSNMEVL